MDPRLVEADTEQRLIERKDFRQTSNTKPRMSADVVNDQHGTAQSLPATFSLCCSPEPESN